MEKKYKNQGRERSKREDTSQKDEKWPPVIANEKNDILRFEYKLAHRLAELFHLND